MLPQVGLGLGGAAGPAGAAEEEVDLAFLTGVGPGEGMEEVKKVVPEGPGAPLDVPPLGAGATAGPYGPAVVLPLPPAEGAAV